MRACTFATLTHLLVTKRKFIRYSISGHDITSPLSGWNTKDMVETNRRLKTLVLQQNIKRPPNSLMINYTNENVH